MATEAEKTELLIEQVKSHPMLYDKTHENFKDVGTKNKLWTIIAKTIDETDAIAVKNKWKNLRDGYIKHLRSHKESHGLPPHLVKQYKTWPWAPQMSFLRQHVKYKPRMRLLRDPLQAAACQDMSEEEEAAEISHARTRLKRPTRKRTLDQNPSPASQVTTSETPVDKVISYLNKKHRDYDDIDLIFMGYAKTVKKMSKNRQAKVKFLIAKIIMESELDETDETEPLIDVKTFHQEHNGFFLFSDSKESESQQ